MNPEVLSLLACPACANELSSETIDRTSTGRLQNAIVWCRHCRQWWPLEEQVLELLPPEIGYADDRQQFYERHRDRFQALGFTEAVPVARSDESDPRRVQQKHFDWYAANSTQSYSQYQQMPFWKVEDQRTFSRWRSLVPENAWLLDVGCAQGRSSFPFADLPIRLVGIDVSKELVREAVRRRDTDHVIADMSFIVGDCSHLPLRDATIQVVVVYGVLHHLPDPAQACQEIARVLRPGGCYLGSENNRSRFRQLFDGLQRLFPLWHEEAGAQPLISAEELERWFEGTSLELNCHTEVFVPPHLVNLLGCRWGKRLLDSTDRFARRIPGLNRDGGLVVVEGKRRSQAAS